MKRDGLPEVLDYKVGDVLLISAEASEARVARVAPRRLTIAWPWREIDPDSENSWDGTLGFPRDPDAYDWVNTPWRLERDPSGLNSGDACFVGIPPTKVRVIGIRRFDPPADFGFLPRPEYVLEVIPVDLVDDGEAGYVLYLNGLEPIEIEVVEGERSPS
ncbi:MULTISPECIES: hypothetical protein [unclassified Micromonospora]|uniref:hypothetical protein n=1 Tax=unclassified Micromonospora TaxID=2617518 RepID=UPI0036314961